MKNNPKKRERRETSSKGMFSLLQSLWVAITIFMLDLNKKVIADE